MNRTIRCLISLLALGTALGMVNEFTLSGTVAAPDGVPIYRAAVKVFGANRILIGQVHTDEEGKFSVAGMAPGTYELRIEASSFSTFQKVLKVPLESANGVHVVLQLTPLDYEVTVTGRHGAPEEAFIEPASVRIRGLEQLVERETVHVPRMLAEEPGILTQETTPGQGSPILRGQSAQSVLYLVDGVRYNNSTYRSGNTQYLGWIPSSAVDSVEVFLGPAGTQYGSDALGGAVHLISSSLPPWADKGVRWGGQSNIFFSSSDVGAGTGLNGHIAGTRAAFSLGGSYRRHQEVRAGGGDDSRNSLRRFLGLDTADVRRILGTRLRDTDYAQSGWHAKLGVRLTQDQFLTFNWIQSEEYGVRRYDRLLGGNGDLRSDITPQRLGFGYARYQKIGSGKLRILETTFSVNRQTDGQITQRRESSRTNSEVSRVTSLGYLFSTSWAPWHGHTLTAGSELYDEFIYGRRVDITPAGGVSEVRPRFPNGTRYQSLGVYVSDDWDALPGRLLVESGVRYSSFRFRSFSDKNVFVGGLPTVPDAGESFHDVTFNSGFTVSLTPAWVTFGRVARGFRAPTVFDLGEQGLTGGGFEVSPQEAVAFAAQIGNSASTSAASTRKAWQSLKPEVLWSIEGGFRWRTNRSTGAVTFFDSEQFDSIERRTLIVAQPVVGRRIGGQAIVDQDDAGRVFVDLDARPVVSRANIGRIRIQGMETQVRFNWSGQWSSVFKAALQRGRELDTRNYARRIAPDTAVVSLRWTQGGGRFWVEGVSEISGPQTRLNPSELDDPRIGAFRSAELIEEFFRSGARRLGLIENNRLAITGETLDDVIVRVLGPDRIPAALFDRSDGFVTAHLRGGLILGESHEISFALMNLGDVNYRKHGSGVDAAGINVSMSYRFRIP